MADNSEVLTCAGCGQGIGTMDPSFWCVDGGETFHKACVEALQAKGLHMRGTTSNYGDEYKWNFSNLNTNGWDALKKSGSSHYKTDGVEPVDLYAAGGMFRHFALCSIIKYAFRNRDGELNPSDMDKIIDYAQKLKAAQE